MSSAGARQIAHATFDNTALRQMVGVCAGLQPRSYRAPALMLSTIIPCHRAQRLPRRGTEAEPPAAVSRYVLPLSLVPFSPRLVGLFRIGRRRIPSRAAIRPPRRAMSVLHLRAGRL